jgi:hypothetical protein
MRDAGAGADRTEGLICMSKFIFCYRAPTSYTPGSADTISAWMAWFGELGANLVDPGDQVFERATTGASVADGVLAGYSVVTADDLDSALVLANGCPGLQEGFSVEVGKLAQLR